MELFSPGHLIVVLVVLGVLFFGWKQLPDMARSAGRSMRVFRTEIKGMTDDVHGVTTDVRSATNDVHGATAAAPVATQTDPGSAPPVTASIPPIVAAPPTAPVTSGPPASTP